MTGTGGSYVESVQFETIEVVTGVSFGLSDSASSGGIEVVVAVQCSDGSVVETTKYLTLNVQKKSLQVATNVTTKTFSTAEAATSIEAVKTSLMSEAVNITAEQANCVGLPANHPDLQQVGQPVAKEEQ